MSQRQTRPGAVCLEHQCRCRKQNRPSAEETSVTSLVSRPRNRFWPRATCRDRRLSARSRPATGRRRDRLSPPRSSTAAPPRQCFSGLHRCNRARDARRSTSATAHRRAAPCGRRWCLHSVYTLGSVRITIYHILRHSVIRGWVARGDGWARRREGARWNTWRCGWSEL